MAGIAGLLLKNNNKTTETHRAGFRDMMRKLAADESQLYQSYDGSWFSVGFVQPVGETRKDRLQRAGDAGVLCLIDGLVIIKDQEKRLIRQHYQLDSKLNDHELLPYFFELYGEQIVHHVSGWYNLLFIREHAGEVCLINDRFGLLPLYYFDSDEAFVFSSRIAALVDAPFTGHAEPDPVTFAEHLFFNYPLSDFTFLKNIRTVPNACFMRVVDGKTLFGKYWEMAELFDIPKATARTSLEIIDEGLKKSVSGLFTLTNGPVNLSLTGGWDSRLILAYLMLDHRERINLYSFGAPGASDILIPEMIAKKERLKYTPFILDEHYLQHCFTDYAKNTIEWSNGTRSYKRAHYVYAIEKISKASNYLLSGLFGDEVFKVTGFTGGAVFSGNTIDMIREDFNIDGTLDRFRRSGIPDFFNVPEKMLTEGFRDRMEELVQQTSNLKAGMEKYYFIRFEKNLRKYFGSEINSYNDYAYCYSPFADYEFLKAFAGTVYMGNELPFNTGDLQLKMRSTMLYARLVKMNYKPLAFYNSSRGFSMHDATTMAGKIKILLKKKFRTGQKNADSFNTGPTDAIFMEFLKKQPGYDHESLFRIVINPGNKLLADIYSFIYWDSYIDQIQNVLLNKP